MASPTSTVLSVTLFTFFGVIKIMNSVLESFSFRERERERERECILKAQVPGVSMRAPLCTYADDLLRCSATVGNLGERGEPDILT